MKTIGWLLILGSIWLFRAAGRGQVFNANGEFVLMDTLSATILALITNDDKALAKADAPGAKGLLEATRRPRELEVVDPIKDDLRPGGGGALPNPWAENPRTVEEALAWAESEYKKGIPIWYRRCLAFIAQAYGLVGSGTFYAIDVWSQVPADMRHTGKVNIPTGALLFWKNNSRAGHVAMYAGNGMVYSTDIGRLLRVNKVRFTDFFGPIWNLEWVGWTPPYFPRNPKSKIVRK